MPDLFSPYTLKGVTLRNRIAMSPMTMHRATDGRMDDFHVMLMGSRAAGGFGLVFPEQIAITPDGRTGTGCAGIYDDSQLEGLSRVAAIVKDMGAVPAIQLGHTGRKGSERKPWHGKTQLPPDHPEGWQVRGPSAIPFGGKYPYPVHAMTVDEIKEIHRAYADAARRALEAGFEWLEMHFAHGYLGASFFSPLANQRTDGYGGSLEKRLRFHREALDAVRAVWPERLPLTMRLGCDDFHEDGVRFDDSVWAVGAVEGARARPGRPQPRHEHGRHQGRALQRGGVHGRAGEPRPARGRNPRGRELEPRAARGGRPGDPRRADRLGVLGAARAVEPALAALGRARTGPPRSVVAAPGGLVVVAAQPARPGRIAWLARGRGHGWPLMMRSAPTRA